MKNILLLFAVSSALFAFGQYPSWLTDEFKNKVFCGEFETSGTMIGGSKTWIKIPYELTISENGVQLRINPGEKFGRDEWGETIKLNYNSTNVIKRMFENAYVIDLSSVNETEDSPITPKYKLLKLVFNVSTYDGHVLSREEQRACAIYTDKRPLGSSIDFHVSVPYYEANGTRVFTAKAVICRTLKTKSELAKEASEQEKIRIQKEKEDLIISKSIDAFLAVKDVKSAMQEYSKLYTKSTIIQDKIQAVLRNNELEVNKLLLEDKIDLAIELFRMTSDNSDILSNIKLKLSEKFPDAQTLIQISRVISVLDENAKLQLQKVAFDKNNNLSIIIRKDGQANLMNGTNVLHQFRVIKEFIATNKYAEFSFPVDAEYSFSLELDTINATVYGLELSSDFLVYRSYYEQEKYYYYLAEKGNQKLVLYKEPEIKENSKKYTILQRVRNFEFSKEFSGKNARIIYTCALKVNGEKLTSVFWKDKNFITLFKKFK
jgi:hypothetical protein